MKTILLASAVSGLALTIIPPILYFAWTLDLQRSQQLMTFGMILWFAGDISRVIARRRRH
jgi:hypothetical protein